MLYAIDPLDVLLLREARPFDSGDSHRVTSVFPPSPLTLQGMIRAALLGFELPRLQHSVASYFATGSVAHEVQTLREWLGKDSNHFGRLKLRGPFVLGEKSLWFPTPLDLAQVTPIARGGVRVRQPTKDRLVATSGSSRTLHDVSKNLLPLVLQHASDTVPDPPDVTLISATDLISSLAGLAFTRDRDDKLYDSEWRIGIERTARRTALAGRLYSAEFIRVRDSVRLVVDLDWKLDANHARANAPNLLPALMRLGGDGHLVTIQPDDGAAAAFGEIIALGEPGGRLCERVKRSGGRFKLYLASPAAFARGWLPDGVDNGLEIDIVGRRCHLVSAAVGKPHYLGGWDMRRGTGRPKPLLATVPAGSVYYFEPVEEPTGADLGEFVGKLFKTHHAQAFPLHRTTGFDDDDLWAARGELDRVGFGVTLVGGWDYTA